MKKYLKRNNILLLSTVILIFLALLLTSNFAKNKKEKGFETSPLGIYKQIWDKNLSEMNIEESAEFLATIPQSYSTFLDGDIKTSVVLKNNSSSTAWQSYKINRLGMTLTLPKSVLVYRDQESKGCERPLVIEDELTSTSTLSEFFITPSTQTCESKDLVMPGDGMYSTTGNDVKVIVMKVKSIEEIKGLLKGIALSTDISSPDACNFDDMELFPSYKLDGFQYYFPLFPEDSQPIGLIRRCSWTQHRPHIKYDLNRKTAIIMIDDYAEWSNPNMIVKLSTGGYSYLSFNRQIFESIRFIK